ncbi:hypothetical protein SAMN05444144_11212 [Flavobacterium akiainvivens]|nr:hypothetical protein SAMN05444144_11212 [Flavobacterium akiainvivens]
MPRLMHKHTNILVLATALLLTGGATAQNTQQIAGDIGRLITDALFFSDKYITPAADAAVYQQSSGWITSPRERGLWDVTFGLHTNVFFTPKRDRVFTVYNDDFQFFQLEEGFRAAVPTALGNDKQVYLTGMIGNDPVRLETPEGIDMETVAYPYLQGSVALPWGNELVVKYSPKVKLEKSNYQVYGVGLKHNISRYFKSLEEEKIHIAVLAAYAKEDVSFNFLNVQTDYGSLGINQINGLVDTWQFQLSASQQFWDDLEFMGSFIVNTSDVKYRVTGETGTIEEIVPLQAVLNDRLKTIYKTRINYIGEFSAAYNIGNFNIQTIVAFGKFVNTNVSLQYLFK